MNQIHAGAVAPYSLVTTIGSALDGFDLTDVTGGVFQILKSSARNEEPYAEWAGVVSDAISTVGGSQLTLTHVYVDGDVPEAGTIYVRAKLDHPEGPIYSRSFPLLISSRF